MKRITYSKFFLTGNLAGLSVRCSLTVPADICHQRSMALQRVNVLNPRKEYGTDATYYIYNVGSEELPTLEVL